MYDNPTPTADDAPAANPGTLEPIRRLTRDLKKAAATLGRREARYLVDTYYQIQEERKRSAAQVRALGEAGEPHDVVLWLEDQSRTLENSIKSALDAYSASDPLGAWARSVRGIGPVIAAGLLGNLDEVPPPTVGPWWRFAGLDPTVAWNKGEKRPWNAGLKVVTWKAGESFVKVGDLYGDLYRARKAYEQQRNISGALAGRAAETLERRRFGKDTEAYLWYTGCMTAEHARMIADAPDEKRAGMVKKLAGEPGSGQPMLPPAHIHARAKRYAVKLFLSHYHEVAHCLYHRTRPPKPYVIGIMGHVDYLPPPGFDVESYPRAG